MILNNWLVSDSVSDDVGSSMISTSAFSDKRLGDFHHLLLSDRQAANQRIGLNGDVETVEGALRIGAQTGAIDENAATRFSR